MGAHIGSLTVLGVLCRIACMGTSRSINAILTLYPAQVRVYVGTKTAFSEVWNSYVYLEIVPH